MFMPLFLIMALLAGYNLQAADSNNNAITTPAYPQVLKTDEQKQWYTTLSSIKNWELEEVDNYELTDEEIAEQKEFIRNSWQVRVDQNDTVTRLAQAQWWKALAPDTTAAKRNDYIPATFSRLTPQEFTPVHALALINGYYLSTKQEAHKALETTNMDVEQIAVLTGSVYRASSAASALQENASLHTQFKDAISDALNKTLSISIDEGPMFNNSDDEQDSSPRNKSINN
jgi:hypothetical protein